MRTLKLECSSRFNSIVPSKRKKKTRKQKLLWRLCLPNLPPWGKPVALGHTCHLGRNNKFKAIETGFSTNREQSLGRLWQNSNFGIWQNFAYPENQLQFYCAKRKTKTKNYYADFLPNKYRSTSLKRPPWGEPITGRFWEVPLAEVSL